LEIRSQGASIPLQFSLSRGDFSMRGTLDQAEFQQAVSLVQGITQSKLSNPVVENVVLRFEGEHAEILATNLSISIRIRIKLEGGEAGEIALPSKLLGQVVRELPQGPVELSLKGQEILIQAGRSKFHLNSLTTEDFPPFLPQVEGPSIEIPVEVAAQCLERTVFATSDERARYQLGGIKFIHKDGDVQWIATDGRRLSRVKHGLEKPGDEDCTMLVPARAAQEVLRALPGSGTLKMTVGEKRVLFEAENVTIASTLLEDNFPPYEGLIPSEYTIQIGVDRDELTAAVRRASVLASERTRLVHLVAKNDTLHVSGERQEAGGADSEMDATTNGNEADASYNANYLIDCLKATGPGKVQWSLVQDGGAAYFGKEDDDTFLHIIMPMTIRDETPEPVEEEVED
jgi:DNA polymerase-3 subunit beta